MALSIKEAKNGYPIALLPSARFENPRPSEGFLLRQEDQTTYAAYIENILNSRNARKRGRTVLAVNTGARILQTLANSLSLDSTDLLFVLEQQPRRIETAANFADHLKTRSLIIGQGNFLASSYNEITELTGNRLDYVVFGLGSPSIDRTARKDSCRIQAEINKARELIREGGSLIISPPKRDTYCVDLALMRTRFQVDPQMEPQMMGTTRALRAIALR